MTDYTRFYLVILSCKDLRRRLFKTPVLLDFHLG